MTMHRSIGIAAFGLALGLCGCVRYASVPIETRERRAAAGDIPEAARVALTQRARGNAITGYEREVRGPHEAYEAEWIEGGLEREATVLDNGALIETSEELTPDEIAALPIDVRAKADRLERFGWDVKIDRRLLVVYEIDAEREVEIEGGADDGGDAGTTRTETREMLLLPNGQSADRDR